MAFRVVALRDNEFALRISLSAQVYAFAINNGLYVLMTAAASVALNSLGARNVERTLRGRALKKRQCLKKQFCFLSVVWLFF